MAERYGASAEDWAHLDVLLGLTADLLPVVSNPNATISPNSSIKSLGKLPSQYNGQRYVSGFPNWTQHQSTADEIAKWSKEEDYGICIQARAVRAIDIDVGDADTVSAIRKHIRPFGLPCRYRQNSSKVLIAFRCEGDYAKRKITTANGIIEFLANGQQFVACGTHPSGARYEWEGGLPDEFPTLTPDEFEAIWQALVDEFAIEPTTEGKVSTRQQVLSSVIDSDPIAQHLLDKNLVARADRDGKLHLAHCPWEDDHTDQDTALTSATYFPAHTGGYSVGTYVCQHAHCSHRTQQEFLDAVGYVPAAELSEFEDLTKGESNGSTADSGLATAVSVPDAGLPVNQRFTVQTYEQFALKEIKTEWLIKHVLPKAEMAVLYGESGSGKTFAVLDMAASIAIGQEWRGHKAPRSRVVYVAAEGANGFRKRMRAYANAHHLDTLPIGVIADAPNLLEKADALDVARAVIAAGGADLIIIDTLAQTMPGGNENSGEDVGMLLKHCKGIHRATKALVLLVHHSGKDASKGARGWSGLRAACDAELEVLRVDEARSIRVSKQKDGDDNAEYGFKLKTVALGWDEDGEEITSCVVEHSEFVPVKAKALGQLQSKVLKVVNELAGADMKTNLAEVRKECEKLHGTRSDAVRRVITELAKLSKLEFDGHEIVLCS